MLRMVARLKARPARDSGQIALDEGDTSALHGDIGARAHRDTDIGFGQRGGIVDPISGHCNDSTLAFKTPNDGVLLIRQNAGFHLSDAELAGDGLSGYAIVAGQHQDADSLAA